LRALAEVGGLGRQQPGAQDFHPGGEFVRAGGIGPFVGQHVLELPLLVKVPEDHVDFADHQLEHGQLGFQQVEDGGFDGAGGDQVEHVDVVVLADAAEPTDPLLDAHRVPRQVEIAQPMRELEVAALAARVGGEQHAGGMTELLDALLLLHAGEPAMEYRRLDPGVGKRLLQRRIIRGIGDCRETRPKRAGLLGQQLRIVVGGQRLDGEGVAVAQQEVDDAQGKDLAAEAQVEAAKSRLQVAQSQMAVSQSKLAHDQALYDYSKITAPFAGVVTQRNANLGTLLQAGTSSQAMPLVKLSEEDLFRLVIPVPESYVRYIKVGDQVTVRVPSLGGDFPGMVARFSVDVGSATRTMHTEVDVPNPKGVLIPGVYAEATLALDRKGDALVVPLQGVNQGSDRTSVMLVDPAGKVQDREVTLGIQTENDAEVLSGLNDGDEIVISDRSGLKPGELVNPKLTEVSTYKSQS